MSGAKVCSQCRGEFPRTVEFFPHHAPSKDGLDASCRGCRRRRRSDLYYRRRGPDAWRRSAFPAAESEALVRDIQAVGIHRAFCACWQGRLPCDECDALLAVANAARHRAGLGPRPEPGRRAGGTGALVECIRASAFPGAELVLRLSQGRFAMNGVKG